MNGTEVAGLVAFLVWLAASIVLVPMSLRETKATTAFLNSVTRQVTAADAASLRRGTAPTGLVVDQIADDAITPIPDEWRLRRVPSIGELRGVRKPSTLRLYRQEVRARRHLVRSAFVGGLALYGVLVGYGLQHWLHLMGHLWARVEGGPDGLADVPWLLAFVLAGVMLPELVAFAPLLGDAAARRYTRRCETMLAHLEALIERKGRADEF